MGEWERTRWSCSWVKGGDSSDDWEDRQLIKELARIEMRKKRVTNSLLILSEADDILGGYRVPPNRSIENFRRNP